MMVGDIRYVGISEDEDVDDGVKWMYRTKVTEIIGRKGKGVEGFLKPQNMIVLYSYDWFVSEIKKNIGMQIMIFLWLWTLAFLKSSSSLLQKLFDYNKYFYITFVNKPTEFSSIPVKKKF